MKRKISKGIYISLLCIFFALSYFTEAIAQSTSPVINSILNGSVIDSSTNQPIEGVSIRIKGTTNQTTTDNKGNFTLKTGQILPYLLLTSLTGYKSREIYVEQSTINIKLELKDQSLSDVVVVGYGTQKRSDLTGSVASVPKQALAQQVSSFDRLLQGSVSGVQVTQASGQPGSAASIRIRGGNSITAGNEPLYVIDGFPIYNDNSAASSGIASGPSINALAAINPSDIESIVILKDASATAIYGSRGANGVVLVTTKKGKDGKDQVTYDGSYGAQKVNHTIDVLTNAKQWALLKNDAMVNAGESPYYTQEGLDTLVGGTDWQAAALRVAPLQNHQLSINGGDSKTHYSISGNYFDQQGILLNTDFKRYSGRLNFDRQVSANFKVGASLTTSKTGAHIAETKIVPDLLLMPPTVPIKDADGNYTYQSDFETPLGNPIATLLQEINQSNTSRFLGNVYGEYTLSKYLTAKVSVSTDILNNKENRYIPKTIYQGANSNTTGTAAVGTMTSTSWLNENTISYTNKVNSDQTLNAVIGFTQQSFRSELVTAGSENFSTEQLTYNDLQSGSVYLQPTSGSSDWTLKSFLARVNYNIKERYLFTISGRADGSSRFGADNKWGYFPSVAFAWNAAKESFLNLPSYVDNLKIRVSAGLTGNQEIGLYKSLSTLASNTYYFGGTTVTGYYPNSIQNPDLDWESTAQYDAGIDLALFQSRINVTLDAYYKKTTNLLLDVPLPYTTGQASALQNYGSVSNKGLELSINTQNIQGIFNWNTNLVLSTNKNKILSLGKGVNNIISGVSIAQVGQPLGSFYGFKTNGIFQSRDDISKLPVYLTKNQPGDQRYVDKDGDKVITTTGDRFIIGNAQPKLLGGLTNNFTYKNFDLSIFLQGSYGNKVFNQNMEQLELLSGQQNASITALDRWTSGNPGNVIPRAYEDPAAVASDRYVEDASYLRIKNLAVGYTTFLGLSNKLNKIKVRFYLSAQNLITWSKYTGYDPEVSKNQQSTLTEGIDYGVYPSSIQYIGGINITF